MNKAALFLSLAVFSLAAACDNTSNPSSKSSSSAPKPTQPDNTANNANDHAHSQTPMDQSNDAKDIEITAEIRRAVVDDATMSTNAKNVKIITAKGGAVTLRGVVDSQAEKDAIEAKAKAVAGVNSVDNQLEVKAP